MCRSPLHPFLARLPKCEHHIHIEGSLMPETLFALAKRNNIALPSSDPAYASPEALLARYSKFTSLDDFLHYYYLGMSTLLTEEDFYDLGMAYLEKAKGDGVVHAEIFFDPQAHLDRSIPLSTILTGLRRACSDALTRFNLTTLLIPCFLRHLPVPSATSLWQNPDFQAAFASGNANGQCVGIGLDSSEVGFPPALFKEIWAEASAKGIRRTMHAGEEGGPENVEAAVFELGCERVDHGIRMASDDALMARIAERKTLVTVCPLSNVELRCVKSVAEVPIKKFLEAGVRFSINSDDPAYFGGFVLDNYCAVQEAHGLGKEEWTRICENAIEGSWCGEERKEEMRGLLRECVKEFESK